MFQANFKSKLTKILTIPISRSSFSYFHNLHKQWLKSIRTKIFYNKVVESDLKEINEKIMNLEDLNYISQLNSLNPEPDCLEKLLMDKLIMKSQLIFNKEDYQRNIVPFLENLESLINFSAENETNARALKIFEDYCSKLLDKTKQNDIIIHKGQEIGYICRILSMLLKQNIKIESQYANMIIKELEVIVNNKTITLDLITLLKYLIFIEKIGFSQELKSLNDILRKKIQQEIEKSYITLRPEDLLILNESFSYFIENRGFIEFVLQKLVYANIFKTDVFQEKRHIINRALVEFTQLLSTFNFEKIPEKSIVDEVYLYLILLMDAAELNIIYSWKKSINKFPRLWLNYIYTIPNKKTQFQLEKKFSDYVQLSSFWEKDQVKNFDLKEKELFDFLNQFLDDYSDFLQKLPNFRRKEFFNLIQINPSWIIKSFDIKIEQIKQLELPNFLCLLKVFHFSGVPQNVRSALIKEIFLRIEYAEKTLNFQQKGILLKCLAEVKFLNDKELENRIKDFVPKEHITGIISVAKKSIFLDFLFMSSFGKRHNEFLNLIKIFQKSLNTGVFSSQDFLQIFILALEQGIYDDEALNKVCMVNIQASLSNIQLVRLIELVILILQYFEYFNKGYPDYCRKIFETTFAKFKENKREKTLLILFFSHGISLSKKDYVKLLLQIRPYVDSQLYNQIKLYASIFYICQEKNSEIEFLKKLDNKSWLVTRAKKWICLEGLSQDEDKYLEGLFDQPLQTDKEYWKPPRTYSKINFQELNNS